MASTLKKQTFSAIFWSGAERFAVQGISFLVQIVLARLLSPSDYGVIAMIAIFLQISHIFIDSGFANALIQKQDCNEKDYNTVFYYNLFVSIFLYVVLFFTAPLISSFYHVELLIPVIRVISISLIFNALSIVQRTILVKRINFRTQTRISLISAFCSGIIGIVMAYYHMGAWALVAQQLSNSFFLLIFFIVEVKWWPSLIWSKESFSHIFSFGSKLVGASLIGVIYSNLYTILIGKRFMSTELGYYSRAESFAQFPSSNIGRVISRVSLPVFSRIQNNGEELRGVYQKLIKYTSLIVFPLMFCLLSVAEPFVVSLLTEKWRDSIPILRVLCLALVFDHISVLNLNLLYVKGRTDLVLKLELYKKSIGVLILFISMPWGIMIMCWGRVLYSIIAVLFNTYYTRKLIGLSFINQVRDFLPSFCMSALIGILIIAILYFIHNNWIQLFVGVLGYFVIYFILCYIFYNPIFKEIRALLK